MVGREVISGKFIKIGSDLQSINDYSSGLSFAIPEGEIKNVFTGVLKSQKMTLDSISKISKDFESISGKLATLVSEDILSIASVAADIGLANASAVKLHDAGSINVEQLELTQSVSGLALDALLENQSVIENNLIKIEKSGIFEISDEVSQSFKIISGGLSEVVQSLPNFSVDIETLPLIIGTARETSEIDEDEISEHQLVLDELLYDISPDLVEFRKSIWDTFNEQGKDYIGQSSSSMRRLVDSLLREMCPDKEVKKTKYFKENKDAKIDEERPTRKARILYITGWDEDRSKHIEKMVTGFLATYDNINAWDHVPVKKHSFVHGTFITIEGYLISILTANSEK